MCSCLTDDTPLGGPTLCLGFELNVFVVCCCLLLFVVVVCCLLLFVFLYALSRPTPAGRGDDDGDARCPRSRRGRDASCATGP